jgi:hypothetical protein
VPEGVGIAGLGAGVTLGLRIRGHGFSNVLRFNRGGRRVFLGER